MPYPESCPECGSTFRNTGTHFTARRNEVGRHVLLELGCQNTTRRFWWDFTTGSPTEDGQPSSARRPTPSEAVNAATANGALHAESNGHVAVATLDLADDLVARPAETDVADPPAAAAPEAAELLIEAQGDPEAEPPPGGEPEPSVSAPPIPEPQVPVPHLAALPGPPPEAPAALKDAFVRQLQLDRLTLRQMRSWLMSDEARRAIEVAAGATEATYERLALILFGAELPHLLGKPTATPQSAGMSAEERLELQREKARIRARLRRAAAKAARG